MSDFKFFGKMGTVMNACPKITRKEVIERAGFSWKPSDGPSDVNDFVIELVYGAHQEVGSIEPGNAMEMQLQGADIMYGIYGEQGLIVLAPGRSEKELRLQGLQRALDFYNYRGSQQLALVGMQLTEDEMRRLRREHRGLYVNQVREELIQEEIDRLQDIDELTTASGPQKSSSLTKKHRGGGRWDIYEEGKDDPVHTFLTSDEAEEIVSGAAA